MKKKEKMDSYSEGYINGINHVLIFLKEMQSVKEPYWSFGDKKIPMNFEVLDLWRTIFFNIALKLEHEKEQVKKRFKINPLATTGRG